MPLNLSIPTQLLTALSPDFFLMVGAMVLMLMSAWGKESPAHQRRIGRAAIVLCVAVLVAVIMAARSDMSAGNGVIAVDNFRWTADVIFLIATIVTIAISMEFYEREGLGAGETHVLLLFATSGMMVMAAARDLMVLFIGIEIMSVAVYVLAGLNRRSNRSAEAALKYFLLGAFSTGFLLYGMTLVFGATGTTNLPEIAARVTEFDLATSPLLLVGIALMLVGFGFKIAAAPFHMWSPDVYEGAPTPVTAYMAVAVKAAAFAALLRVWLEALPGVYTEWHRAVWWLAALTMLIGNLVALQQRNLKRMLAYSSIGHTGFILVALAAGTPQGASAFLFYMIAYMLATMGAFAVIIAMGSSGQPHEMIEDYHGLWHERPGMAIGMTVFMLALLGFPIFGGVGFFAKWYVLQAAIQAPAPQMRLAVVLVIATTISAGYYLGVIMAMFMKPRPATATPVPAMSGMLRTVIVGTAAAILILGVFPDRVVSLIQRSSSFSRVATDAPASAPAPEPR